MSRKRALHELPERRSRRNYRCVICLDTIPSGTRYRAGRQPRRAHLACAAAVADGRRREPMGDEIRALDEAEQEADRVTGQLYRYANGTVTLTPAEAMALMNQQDRVSDELRGLLSMWAKPMAAHRGADR